MCSTFSVLDYPIVVAPSGDYYRVDTPQACPERRRRGEVRFQDRANAQAIARLHRTASGWWASVHYGACPERSRRDAYLDQHISLADIQDGADVIDDALGHRTSVVNLDARGDD